MNFSSIIGSIKEDLKGFDLTGETSLILKKDGIEKEFKVKMVTLTSEEHLLIPELVAGLGEDVTSFTQMDRYRKLTVLLALRSLGPLDLTNTKFVNIDEDNMVERYKVFEELLKDIPDYIYLELWEFYINLVEKQKESCKVVTKVEKQEVPILKDKKMESAFHIEGTNKYVDKSEISKIVGKTLTDEEADKIREELDNKQVYDLNDVPEHIQQKSMLLENPQ